MNVWVVGGTTGIGYECAKMLSSAGYDVSATGSETNVRSSKILAAYANEYGPFGGLVYAAGLNYLEWTENLDCEEAAGLYDVNVLGLVRVLQAAQAFDGRAFRSVVIGSDAAWRPMRTSLAYNASKAALHMAVLCIARERAAENWTINVVAPGLTADTQMTDYVIERTRQIRGWVPGAVWDYMIPQIPLGRPADPVEVAMVVRDVFESPPYLNGAIIPVSGAR